MRNIFDHSMLQYKMFLSMLPHMIACNITKELHVSKVIKNLPRTFYAKLAEIFFLIKRNGKTFFTYKTDNTQK